MNQNTNCSQLSSIPPSHDYFARLVKSFLEMEEVDAVVLGGSRTGREFDEHSDYDVYLYCHKVPNAEVRLSALKQNCQLIELGNHYWELEDNIILKNGIPADLLYRNLTDFKNYLTSVVQGGQAWNSYTTCFWRNIIESKILFDKSGDFTKLQQEFTISYPENLRRNIIVNARKLLSGRLPSYDNQIRKAEGRGDIVSLNHRSAEFLATYFDLILALNRIPHPGEKRLLSFCERECQLLPKNFSSNITSMLAAITEGAISECVDNIIQELDVVLKKEGISIDEANVYRQ